MTRKTDFFEGSSWFKLSNLGLVLGMALKIYSSLPKGLKLRVKNNFIKKEIPAKMFFCVFRGGSRTTAASKMERFMIVTKRSILDVTTVLDPPLKFGKISKNIFWQSTSGWLFLKFIREFWEVFQNISFIEHLWKTAYFMYKFQYSNQQNSEELFHRCLFKHCIHEHKK